MEPKVVIFDLEDTMIHSWHKAFETIYQIDARSKEQLFENSVRKQFYAGTITEDAFWDEQKALIGLSPPAKALKRAVRSVMEEIPGAVHLVELVKTKYRVALLSSYPKEWFEYVDQQFGLRSLFERVFVSGYTGLRKNEPAAYLDLCKKMGVDPSDCLLIDDLQRNVGLATSLGIAAIRFTDVASVYKKLGWMGLKTDPLDGFRPYDVRGVYGFELDKGIALQLGRALGVYFKGKSLFVARDYRNGSPELASGLIAGLRDVGAGVVDGGILPTPLYYFMVDRLHVAGGAMVTASHNPHEWNGVKMYSKEIGMIYEEHGMKDLRALFTKRLHRAPRVGAYRTQGGSIEEYISYVTKTPLQRPLKVVLDPGNGCWAGIAKTIFKDLGCKVKEINPRPGPKFAGRGPNPTETATMGLQAAVVANEADFGAAFDSDGDRVAFVDERGRFMGVNGITGNCAVPFFASHYLKARPGSAVVIDASSSSSVTDFVKRIGGVPIIARSGRGYMLDTIHETGAVMGGEYSSHLFFKENGFIDDGCFAAVKMARILSMTDRPLSSLLSDIPVYASTPIEDIYCPDDKKAAVLRKTEEAARRDGYAIDTTDGIKAIGKHGWVLIRASNTSPRIRINADSISERRADELMKLGRSYTLSAIKG